MNDVNQLAKTYRSQAVSNIFRLMIYWGIVYLIYRYTYKNSFSVENVAGAIEVVSVFAIILFVIMFISNLLGNLILGFIVSAIVLIAACGYGDKYMQAHHLSNSLIENIFLILGLLFNLICLFRIIQGLRYYKLCKYSERQNLPHQNNLRNDGEEYYEN